MARDKPTDPQPRGKGQDGRSLTSNLTPTLFNTSTATPTPKLPKPMARDPLHSREPYQSHTHRAGSSRTQPQTKNPITHRGEAVEP